MSPTRIDNVSVVVLDLDAAIAFFEALGLEVEGRTTVEGELVDRIIGLSGTRSEVAMMRAPDGDARLEMTRYLQPAAVGPDPGTEPANTRGTNRIMFNVEDIAESVKRLQELGGELVGEIVRYGDAYRLCYMRGPEGIIIALAESLTERAG